MPGTGATAIEACTAGKTVQAKWRLQLACNADAQTRTKRTVMPLSRRDFLEVGALSASGIMLSGVLHSENDRGAGQADDGSNRFIRNAGRAPRAELESGLALLSPGIASTLTGFEVSEGR